MNYIKTQFDHNKLIRNIDMVNAVHNTGYLVLTASKSTLDIITQEETSSSFLPNREGLIAQYMGYKVFRDDTLGLGELKIYKEVG